MSAMMYTPHPPFNSLAPAIPEVYVQAVYHEHEISWPAMTQMRKFIRALADQVETIQPDLVFFFATGGIPYVVPMLHVLAEERHRMDVTTPERFHMFPGLAWGRRLGSPPELTTKQFFLQETRPLLKSNQTILAIDTTNSGNAVNLAAAACIEAVRVHAVQNVKVYIVGIVDGSRAERHLTDDRPLRVKRCCGDVFVKMPHGLMPSETVRNRRFTQFQSIADDLSLNLRIAYWIAREIPTEDRAEVLGVHAIHNDLRVSMDITPGRLLIRFRNGRASEVAGGRSVGSNFLHLLYSRDSSVVLRALQQRGAHRAPRMSVEDQRVIDLANQTMMRLVELDKGDRGEVITGLIRKPALLHPNEVYWLIVRHRSIPANIRPKLLASIDPEHNNLPEDMLQALRDCLPKFARQEPQGRTAELLQWWHQSLKGAFEEGQAPSGE